jgi:hypothetical protein
MASTVAFRAALGRIGQPPSEKFAIVGQGVDRISSFKNRKGQSVQRPVKRFQVGLFLAAILAIFFLFYRLQVLTSSIDADANADAASQNIKVQQQNEDHAPPTPQKPPQARNEKQQTPQKPPQARNEKPQMAIMKNGSNNNTNKPLPAPGYADSTVWNPYQATTATAESGSPTAVQVLHKPLDDKTAKIIPMAEPLVSSPHTMVIAYFNVKSKYTAEKYEDWMANIFSLQDCMVVFTQPDMVETVQRLRAHAANRTVIVVQPSITDLPVSQLYQQSHPNFWQDQLTMDREGKHHKSFELFWIWLSKSWWVMQAVERNFFRSDFFMYSDIGCFRNKKYNGKTLIQHPSIVPDNTVMWMAHHAPNPPATRLWNDKFREKPHFYHSGSQGAGTAEAWRRFHQVFAETMDQFAANSLFIGEDQCILQSACMGSYYDSAPIGNNSPVATGVCTYAPFDQVQDNHYFGLRHVLYKGGDHYKFFKPPLEIDMAR